MAAGLAPARPVKRSVGRPRGSNTDMRREMIISAAVRMFAYRGYDAATLREVADLVGITRTAVHHYFSGKAPLYRAALDRACEIVLPTAARPETLACPPEHDVALACALLGTSLAQSHRIADIAPRITSISADLRRICAAAAPPRRRRPAGRASGRADRRTMGPDGVRAHPAGQRTPADPP